MKYIALLIVAVHLVESTRTKDAPTTSTASTVTDDIQAPDILLNSVDANTPIIKSIDGELTDSDYEYVKKFLASQNFAEENEEQVTSKMKPAFRTGNVNNTNIAIDKKATEKHTNDKNSKNADVKPKASLNQSSHDPNSLERTIVTQLKSSHYQHYQPEQYRPPMHEQLPYNTASANYPSPPYPMMPNPMMPNPMVPNPMMPNKPSPPKNPLFPQPSEPPAFMPPPAQIVPGRGFFIYLPSKGQYVFIPHPTNVTQQPHPTPGMQPMPPQITTMEPPKHPKVATETYKKYKFDPDTNTLSVTIKLVLENVESP